MSTKSSYPFISKPPNYRASTLKVIMLALLIFAIGILITVPFHTVYSGDGVCKTLEGATFRSDKESGDPFGGTMRPSIAFRNGTYNWSISDMLITGSYECKSGEITASTSYDNRAQTVQLDPVTGILLWNGDIYKKTSEPARILGQNQTSMQDQIWSKIGLLILGIGIFITMLITLGGGLHTRR